MFWLFLVGAYLFGAIPTGVILTRLSGKDDIRKAGSGNIGATNVYRVAGRGLGVLTLVGDCLKGAVPVLFARTVDLSPDQIAMVALAAFCGHCYPVYLRFKGGKGVATALGVFLVLSPPAVLVALVVFALFLWHWRYISLASIAAAATMPAAIFLTTRSTVLVVVTLLIAAIVIWRHRGNIERLRSGTESRFTL